MRTDGKALDRMHASWTDPAYWRRIAHWIEIGFKPRPVKANPLWVWPEKG